MPSHYGIKKKSMCPCSSNRKKPMRKQAVVKKKPMKKQLTQSQMGKLLSHSKNHKGGMRSKHMAIMIREMKNGVSFDKAHKIAMKG